MNKKNSIWLLVAVWTLVSCGTVKSTREKPAVALAQSSLTPEQQRKYDYFFLEAMRLKEKKDYASAFGLLQHCLDIHPNAASALYEVSQYYMFLRQVPQGQEALEKAVANAPDNYWYSQGLASLYQQQNELDKAVTLLEQMVVRFPAKQDPLFNLLDLYGRQHLLINVISLLFLAILKIYVSQDDLITHVHRIFLHQTFYFLKCFLVILHLEVDTKLLHGQLFILTHTLFQTV